MSVENVIESVRQNLLEINPVDRDRIERPHVDEHLPEIFTLGQVEKLLMTALLDTPRLIPLLCVGFFAGLRTGELEGLKWSNIGMRHTYASNHLAKNQDISKTALQLGHTGPYDILFNH
jgi:integrase